MKSVSGSAFRCRGINAVKARKRENEKARCPSKRIINARAQSRKEPLFKIFLAPLPLRVFALKKADIVIPFLCSRC